MRKTCPRLWCGIIVYIIIACFSAYYIYFRDAVGDDILSTFENFVYFYLDDFPHECGAKVTTFSQVLHELKNVWLYWSGRIPGYALLYLGDLLSKVGQAIFTSLLYVSIVFLTLRIVYKSSKGALSSPISALILFSSLYWFRIGAFYTYMWIMTAINSLAVCLCLLYFNLTITDPQQGKRRGLLPVSVIGFLAGSSHEVISLCMIAVIGTFYLISLFRKQEK